MLLVSCSMTKGIPEDEQLFTGLKKTVYCDEKEYDNEAYDDHLTTTKEELENMETDIFSISRGMVSVMNDIKNVDIWANFTEGPQGVICELRSSKYNINPIAVKYGGGGHMKACGATLKNREEAMLMLNDLDRFMEENQ